jgi:hypothetical protein
MIQKQVLTAASLLTWLLIGEVAAEPAAARTRDPVSPEATSRLRSLIVLSLS